MTAAEKEMLNKYCYNHDLTYFIDTDGKHCLCDVDWIVRLETEGELINYIKEH